MADIDPEERALFRASVGEVIPVRHDRHPRTPPARSRRREIYCSPPSMEVIRHLRDAPFDYGGGLALDPVFYARDGVPRAVGRRLKRGQYRIEAELDLHGLRLEEARRALVEFLREARRRHLGCVRVIHGKGWRSGNTGPVLKPNVNLWLRQFDDVLAYCSAQAADGGTGALYVLLGK